MNRAVTAAALLGCAACLTVLAACAGQTAGDPRAADRGAGGESTAESTAEQAPSSPSEEPDRYTVADLCGLLEPAEATGLGGDGDGETAYSTTTGAELCRWNDEMSLIVGLQEGADLAGNESGPDRVITRTTVGDVPALRKVTPSLNACEIMIDLPGKGLFLASATPLAAGEGEYDPCAVADELASITVPRVTDDE